MKIDMLELQKYFTFSVYDMNYIENFSKSFPALIQFAKRVRKEIGIRNIYLVPDIESDGEGGKFPTLFVAVSDADWRSDTHDNIYFEVDGLCNAILEFFENELDVTKDIYIGFKTDLSYYS